MKNLHSLIETISPEKVRNILIVKQHNQFGDMICTLPSFAAVRKKYPDAHMTLICSPENAEILRGNNPYIDKFLVYDKSSITKIINFYFELRKRKYEIGIVPSTVAFSRTSHIINRLSGAKIRVGVKSADNKQNSNDKYLDIKRDFHWNDENRHQTERFLDIVRQIGCDLAGEEKKEVKIYYSPEEINFANNFFTENFPDKSRPVISFQPGAGKIKNRWSLENFNLLIEKLFQEFNSYILLLPGPVDKILNEELCLKLSLENIPFVVDHFPIRITSLLLSMCDLYITNDTGTMHSAAYSGAPVISLFGPMNGWEWAPEKDNCIFIQSKTENITDISVEEVYQSAKNYLKKFRKI